MNTIKATAMTKSKIKSKKQNKTRKNRASSPIPIVSNTNIKDISRHIEAISRKTIA